MMRQSAVAAIAFVMMATGPSRAENLVSGPQVGDGVPGELRVLFLNGEHAGKKQSPVSAKGYRLPPLSSRTTSAIP